MKLKSTLVAAFSFAAMATSQAFVIDFNALIPTGAFNVGDTITWVPTTKGHNVEMIASPNDMKLKSKNGKEVQVTFDAPGIYYYWCTPHKGMGMIGLVVVGGDTSNKDQIAKAKAMGKSKKKLKKLLGEL